jgi:hypothetical protein
MQAQAQQTPSVLLGVCSPKDGWAARRDVFPPGSNTTRVGSAAWFREASCQTLRALLHLSLPLARHGARADGSTGKASAMETVSRRRQRRRVFGVLVLLCWLSAGVGWAGFEEGVRAYQQGEFSAAVSAFMPLAQQGDARAQYNLGVLYLQGAGVPQDVRQAAQWFHRAAAQAESKAQYNLGLLYATGTGVPRDEGAAYIWFTLAATHLPPGDAQQQAVHTRDLLAARLTPAQVQAAQDHVRTWQPRPEAATDDAPVGPRGGSAAAPLTASRIAQAQRRLNAAGFDPGPADGTLGPKTREALRQYQRSKGFPATGELDAHTLAALHGR